MNWKDWRFHYQTIINRLNLDPLKDEYAARILNDLLPDENPDRLRKIIAGREAIVFGAGPSLESDIDRLERAGWLEKVIISADGATTPLLKYKTPDVIVTDLDGEVKDQIRAWRRGAWIVVHAHGDNIRKIERIVPQFDKRIVGTTQTRAFGKLFNFGGFTDGDRAAFLLHEFGAAIIFLAGMDLGTTIGKYSGKKEKDQKLIKLNICKELLGWLRQKRGAEIVNLTKKSQDIPGVSRVKICGNEIEKKQN